MKRKWVAGALLCALSLAAHAAAEQPGAGTPANEELAGLRAAGEGCGLRDLAGGGGPSAAGTLTETEKASLSGQGDPSLRALTGGDDPQGRDMGRGYCAAHGNYTGPSCPQCAAGTTPGDTGSGGPGNPTKFLVVLALAFLVILCISVVFVL